MQDKRICAISGDLEAMSREMMKELRWTREFLTSDTYNSSLKKRVSAQNETGQEENEGEETDEYVQNNAVKMFIAWV